jgi:hypothetical protein
MATKRCLRGEFLLRPDPETVQTYLYVLGYFQRKYTILLHELATLSNHDHPLYTDPKANGPLFIQQVHSLTARALNHFFGESDSFWSGQQHNALRLLEPADVERRSVYIMNNAVKAGLVRYAWDWRGASSWHMEYGVPIKVKRPDFFFSKKMPEEVEVVITRPEGLYPGLSDREARAKLREKARVAQGDLIAERRAKGRTFMGMKRVLRQPRHNTPSRTLERGGIRPHIGARNKWARIEALQDLKRFRQEHEAARQAHLAGERDPVFPPGTYLMTRRLGFKARPPP